MKTSRFINYLFITLNNNCPYMVYYVYGDGHHRLTNVVTGNNAAAVIRK